METTIIEDSKYFKEIAAAHEEKLLKLVEVSESYLDKSKTIPEDYRGLMTAAVCKTKLLVNEKIRQFYGLCQANMNPEVGELTITNDDLAGFWDLIMIQVKILYRNFKFIAESAKQNWPKPLQENQVIETKKSATKPPPRKSYPSVKSVIGPDVKKSRSRKDLQKENNDVQIIWPGAQK